MDSDKKILFSAYKFFKDKNGLSIEPDDVTLGRLTRILSHPDPEAKIGAAFFLGKIKNLPLEQETALAFLVNDSDPRVRYIATKSLAGSNTCRIEMFFKLLDDPDRSVRLAAEEGIKFNGNHGKKHSEVIAKYLASTKKQKLLQAIKAIGTIDEDSRVHVPTIVHFLTSSDSRIRSAAVFALGEIAEYAEDHAHLLVRKIEESEYKIKIEAARAIKAMGKYADGQEKSLISFLKNRDPEVRSAALSALGRKHVQLHAKEILALLKDSNSQVRLSALWCLGSLGHDAASFLGEITLLLRDPIPEVRIGAVKVLVSTEIDIREQADLIFKLTEDPNLKVRISAIKAIAVLGKINPYYTDFLVKCLTNPVSEIRISSIESIRLLGVYAKNQAEEIIQLAGSSNENTRDIAAKTIEVFNGFGKTDSKTLISLLNSDNENIQLSTVKALRLSENLSYEKNVTERLKDFIGSNNSNIKAEAIKTLVSKGEFNPERILDLDPYLFDSDEKRIRIEIINAIEKSGNILSIRIFNVVKNMLDDPVPEIRMRALNVLIKHCPDRRQLIKVLFNNLNHSDENLRIRSVEKLSLMASFKISKIVQILKAQNNYPIKSSDYRFFAYLLIKDKKDVFKILNSMKELSKKSEIALLNNSNEKSKNLLMLFIKLWPESENLPDVRKNFAESMANVIKYGKWKNIDLPLLLETHSILKEFSESDTVSNMIFRLEWTKRFVLCVIILALQFMVWIILMLLYPHSNIIRAVFFWDPWIRKITGFAYIGILLIWIPFLRKRLFIPYKNELTSGAQLDSLNLITYFNDVQIIDSASNEKMTLSIEVIEKRGAIIIEGVSGLGKSTFLQNYLLNTKRTAVFLHAKKCKNGVIVAIQNKLGSIANDTLFLRKLLYVGGLDIVIDSLDEVSSETREKIFHFITQFGKCNILLATQPLLNNIPSSCKRLSLLPLRERDIEIFLLSRFFDHSNHGSLNIEKIVYENRCRKYLKNLKNPVISIETREKFLELLTNPLDLSIVSILLFNGRFPDLFNLQEQQLELLFSEYRKANRQFEFPMDRFSEYVFEMVSENINLFPDNIFQNELIIMHKLKMVNLFEEAQREKGNSFVIPKFGFRHPRIKAFFLMKAIFNSGEKVPPKYFGDPRFKEAILLMAELIPMEESRELKFELLEYATTNKSHSLSDRFCQRLREREYFLKEKID